MSQTLSPANPAQQTFIHTLADQLGLRKLDSYLDSRFGYPAPEHMTSSQASHIIDVLKLRKLSQRVNRPIGVDLTDRNTVRRELGKLEALDPFNRSNKRSSRGANYTVKHVEPCPANLSTAQMSARAIEARQVRDASYATGRYAQTVGRGSNASYSVQVADSRTMGAEPLLRQATEPMLDYIRSLSEQKNFPVGVIPTRFDLAQELLNELIASPKLPTAAMKRELADLRKATDTDPESTPASVSGTYEEVQNEIKGHREYLRMRAAA